MIKLFVFYFIGFYFVSYSASNGHLLSAASNVAAQHKTIALSHHNNGEVINGCECEQYSCQCCEHIQVMPINGTICINFSYLPDEYGVSATIAWNNNTVFNETISLRNPPPICFYVPECENFAELCLRIYDLKIENKQFHGCLKVIARFYHIIHKSIQIGCIDLPKKKSIYNFSIDIHANNTAKLYDNYNFSMNNSPSVIMV